MSQNNDIEKILKTHLYYIDREFVKINIALEKLDDLALINERIKNFESHMRNHHDTVVESIKTYQHTEDWALHINNHIYTSKDVADYLNNFIDSKSATKRVQGIDDIKKAGITRVMAVLGTLFVALLVGVVTYMLKEES